MEAEHTRVQEREDAPPAPADAIDAPPAPAPPEELGAPKVVSNLSRCPYCHDEVRSERADWVACEGCLARHHASCWRERGSCASCHARGALTRPRSRRRLVTGVLLIGLLAGVSGGFFAAKMLESRESSVTVTPTVKTAQDEALLALGFLRQMGDQARFMNRMVAAAARYDELGKPADAKLLRDVAARAVAHSYSEALECLRIAMDREVAGPARVDIGGKGK